MKKELNIKAFITFYKFSVTAEDNASGTGLMMQLAKEISEEDHYYTYMFVSFDGEEAQEKGSDYFVKNFEDIDSIKMAIILDQALINNLSGQYQYIIAGDTYLPAVNVVLFKIILVALLLGLMIFAVRYIIVHRENNAIVISLGMIMASILFATIQCLLIRFGLTTIFKKVPIFWVVVIWIVILGLEIKFLKQIFIKDNIGSDIRFASQQIINIAVFIILSLVSSYEYATIVIFNGLIYSLIYKSIGLKYKKVRFIFQGLYIAFHFIITLAVFNVFLRGVNIRNFTFLHIANLFIFMTMKINVFSSSNTISNDL